MELGSTIYDKTIARNFFVIEQARVINSIAIQTNTYLSDSMPRKSVLNAHETKMLFDRRFQINCIQTSSCDHFTRAKFM